MLNSTISRRLWLTTVLAAGLVSVGVSNPVRADHKPGHKIGLEGYCPICILEARKWEKGRPEINSTYDGVTYYFPNESFKRKFDASPAKYVPALGGDCVVCYENLGKRVPGNIRFGSTHQNRVYLFPSDGERKTFQKSPSQFVNTDLAANGECVVCRAKVNKRVPGSTRFSEIHNGFRYLFPSAGEQAEFRRDPQQYASLASGLQRTTASRASMKKEISKSNMVRVAGKSACAGCEHGVAPIGSPDELGLAVNIADGRVVVVEDAHRLYPDVYSARFQGQNIEVSGKVIRTDGKISWLKPTSLRVLK